MELIKDPSGHTGAKPHCLVVEVTEHICDVKLKEKQLRWMNLLVSLDPVKETYMTHLKCTEKNYHKKLSISSKFLKILSFNNQPLNSYYRIIYLIKCYFKCKM